jgi:copper chaperone CopZ
VFDGGTRSALRASRRREAEEVMKREFHIKGMHCESCAVEISEQLETTAGVSGVDVNYGGKTANVEFDDSVVQEKTLVKKIQDLGYQATVADEPHAEARGA